MFNTCSLKHVSKRQSLDILGQEQDEGLYIKHSQSMEKPLLCASISVMSVIRRKMEAGPFDTSIVKSVNPSPIPLSEIYFLRI